MSDYQYPESLRAYDEAGMQARNAESSADEVMPVVDQDFAEYIERERQRLVERRGDLWTQQNALQHALEAIDREFAAIEAYEAAKTGKAPRAENAAPASRQRRVRSGSRREEVLNIIRDSEDGMSRGALLKWMGVKGDKNAEMSVSNALTVLTKRNQLVREDGKYRLPTQPLHEAA